MNNRSWWTLRRERPLPPMPQPTQRLVRPRIIVVGNEKGGAGKSTVSSLIAIAMIHRGARVALIDLDLRQSSLARFMANRRRYLSEAKAQAPMPLEFKLAQDTDQLSRTDPAGIVHLFEQAIVMAQRSAEIIVIDTPGGDTPVSRAAHLQAELVVTPMNDSFVDFDVLGSHDPVRGRITPSHYAQVVHEARRTRAGYGLSLDWVVLPNRLANFEARNRERLRKEMEALARQVGFRIGPGLHERVIYRELFPYGLTIADLALGLAPVEVSTPREAVWEELRAMLAALDLDKLAFDRPPTEPPAARRRW